MCYNNSMNSILTYISNITLALLPCIPVLILYRIFAIYIRKKSNKGTTLFHEIGVILLLLSILGIFSQTINIYDMFHYVFTHKGSVNLIPFKEIIGYFNSDSFVYSLINLVGNILIFSPIGFFPPLLWKQKIPLLSAALWGFTVSLFIESCQFFTYRTTDIDDLILNTMGACLGYLGYYIVNKLFPDFCCKFLRPSL